MTRGPYLLPVMQLRHVDLADRGGGEWLLVEMRYFVAPVMAQLGRQGALRLAPRHEVGALADAVKDFLKLGSWSKEERK